MANPRTRTKGTSRTKAQVSTDTLNTLISKKTKKENKKINSMCGTRKINTDSGKKVTKSRRK